LLANVWEISGTIPLGLGVAPCDSLLGIQASKISLLQKLAAEEFLQTGAKAKIQWLIMTSQSTEQATRNHLTEVVPATGLTFEQITIFSQAEIPAFDNEGNLMLSNRHTVVTAPNGNGGLYSALAAHLPEMKLRGVKYFHVYCVDNILCKVADPHLLGFFIEKRADVATKTILKKPGELVGSVCLDNGCPRVVEYSELGAELAERKTDDGRLLFCAGSIANHLFSLDFLESFCSENFRLPYHRASKKIAHLSSDGKIMKPVSPNGIKLEQFVFDVFERSKNFYIWEVEREDEFSPLKNAESAGKECLSTCKKDLASLNRKWLESSGAKVIGDPIYLQTSVSYCGERYNDALNDSNKVCNIFSVNDYFLI
uniref:UDP-N-acetylglucosamine diphosphorylase n=1 Tax=Angiostrongylus costaricensis TaxID=334426 RepID=A0A0R3PTH5_ANGCS